MKKTWLLSILLLTLFAFGRGSNYNPDKRFTVAFYNVEDLFDTRNDPNTYDDAFTPSGEKHWTAERYMQKLDHIGRVLTSLNVHEYPEIIGMAEVENRQVLLDLIRSDRFNSAYYKIVHENSPDMRGIDVAMLYRPDEFQYIQHHSIPIQFPFDPESKVRDILHIKGVAAEKDTLHVFINHWKSRAGGRKATEQKRIYSARVLKRYTDSLIHHNPKARIVIIGDFNDEPRNKSLSQVLEAECPGQEKEEGNLYNLMCEKTRDGRGTYYYRKEWYRLDNFIVSSPLLKERGYHISGDKVRIFDPPWVLYAPPGEGEKIPDRTYGGNDYYGGYSDHLAIYGTFRYVSEN
ncbi:MAG: endonuclease [Bacteroidales bacterium]|nr:endonuclease [Bacteroidales bacterium]